jgi:hypothetical protein
MPFLDSSFTSDWKPIVDGLQDKGFFDKTRVADLASEGSAEVLCG